MINKIVEFSLNNKFLIIIVFLILLVVSILYLPKLPVDAIPDIGENQVIVYVDWQGRSPKDVEDQITYPLSTALLGTPGVKTVRGNSMFGFSMINILFDENVDFYWARTRVMEKLNSAQKDLPNGVTPVLGPDATALGQIFWYTVEGKGYDLGELRTLQDWYIKYQLTATKGVSEVGSVGGFVKQYQIDIDPNKLLSYHIPLSKVIMAVKHANKDVGAQVIEESGMEFIVRSIGFIRSIRDIENVVIGVSDNVPIYVKNVGSVKLGPDFRRSVLDKSGKEVVGGVVLMRYGENPKEVIKRIKKKIESLSMGLPKGVKIVPFYDRTLLVNRAMKNLFLTILLEIIITIFVIFFFLMEIRSSLTVSLGLPVAVFLSMLFLYFFKISPNIMSLGGIAMAIGVIVDAGIVIVENIYKHILSFSQENSEKKVPLFVYIDAVKEVASPIFYTMIIVIVAFANIYFLQGQSGKLFKPLAFAQNFVMIVAAVTSITLIPVISVLLIKKPKKQRSLSVDFSEKINRSLSNIYIPSLKWVLHNKGKFIIICISILIAGFVLFSTFESEFMPPLDEGDLLFMPMFQSGASITEIKRILAIQDKIIKSFPEVESVVGKAGRADTPTDPAPISMIETIIHLKPQKKWRKGMTKSKLLKELNEKLKIPGVANVWTQPIRNRVDMLATGIQTPIGVKIFGENLTTLEKIAKEIETTIKTIPGNRSPYAERIGNKPYIEIEMDRQRAARFGINIDNFNQIIMSAIGGMNITKTVEGRERNPVRVRYMREYRGSINNLKRILIPTKTGEQIPLFQIADIKKINGPTKIATENGMPYVRVFVDVDTSKRGILNFVEEAKKKVSKTVKLPPRYFIVWSGQYEYELKTRKRLMLITPLTLVIIFFLLYMKFKNYSTIFAILSALPFGFVGGILLQLILGIKSSTAVTVGYIALFGTAVENGVVLMEFLIQKTKTITKNFEDVVLSVGASRIRPILMTTLTTIIALIPVLISQGSGAEIMRPIAVPIFGGLITATLANLYLLPVLFLTFQKKIK